MTAPTAESLLPGSHTVAGPDGPIETLVTGSGVPVTVFLHGLAGSITMTRPFGSGVAGSRVFAHLRGHGGTPVPSDPGSARRVGGYPELGTEAAAVLAAVGARRAVGISLGAGALLAALAAPSGDSAVRLDRLVLLLPPPAAVDPARAAADPPREEEAAATYAALADGLEAGDVEAVGRALRSLQPAAVRRLPAVALWARRHAADLVAGRSAGLAELLRALPGTRPVTDRAGIDRIAHGLPPGAVLVIAQDGDPVHPVPVARRWAELLGGRLEVLPPGGLSWTGRERARDLIASHLDE